MTEIFKNVVVVVESVAVLLLLIGLTVSTMQYLSGIVKKQGTKAYLTYRRNLGRTLLLTLEFLIAADILDTVAVEKTMNSIGILGVLVLVRTFLSFALELEMNGRWPWQGKSAEE